MSFALNAKTDSFELAGAVDSSDILYRLEFELADEKLNASALELKDKALNQSLSRILSFCGADFVCQGLEIEWLLYALKTAIKNFQGADVHAGEAREVDLGELVCRCVFLDRPALEKAFAQNRGDFKKALLQTNASMICSSCSGDVKAVYEDMSFSEEEERREEVKRAAQKLLDDFSLYCPSEYEAMVFSVASVKSGSVKVKVEGERRGLGRSQIQKTLESFLKEICEQGYKISVFF